MVNRQVATTSSWIFVGLFGLAFITFRPLARPLPKAEGNTTPAAGSAAKIDFQRDIQPILVQSCYRCHGPAQQMSGLRLDSKQAALVGGQSGNVILQNPQPGSTGNTAVNLPGVKGPGALGLDMALSKKVRITEKTMFTLRADAINILNKPQWGLPNTNINSTTFGRITTATGSRVVLLNARVDF